MIFFPFSYFFTETVVLRNHADTQLYLHVALRSVSLHLIFTTRISAMILTNMLIFKFKSTDLIHLNYSFKVMFTLRKDFIPTKRILNRHLFMIQKKKIMFHFLNFFFFNQITERIVLLILICGYGKFLYWSSTRKTGTPN